MARSPRSRTRPLPAPPAADPAESAEAAGLRYVSDAKPGITRKRSGKGFRYVGPDGKAVRDAATLERVRALAIPPAYTDVWICPDPRGHIQATGRDARGRKQYRYHPRWHAVRDETKFGRMLAFAGALPAIRERVEADMARPGLPREKVLATVVHLLENTCIRVGNDEYSRSNDSYGLTTLQDGHAEVSGATVSFRFRGKSGKTHEATVSDRRVARIVQRSQELPGEELFQYLDESGEVVDVGSGDVNDYLREITGQPYTAKDFRTWAGTILAAQVLAEGEPGETKKEVRSRLLAAVDQVAEQLNNTRAVCRKYYIHPAVLESFESGHLAEALKNGKGTNGSGTGGNGRHGLSPQERAIVRLLERAAGAAD
jgi:DNA topoisomerase I